MINELLYLTSRRKNSVSFPPDVQQLLDLVLSCLLCLRRDREGGVTFWASQTWTGAWGSTQSPWAHSRCPGSSGHREGGHQCTQEHSRCWAVQHVSLLSLLPQKLSTPEQWGVPHLDHMAFILSRGWLWVQKNRKIIKFYSQHPAPNRNFFGQASKSMRKSFI